MNEPDRPILVWSEHEPLRDFAKKYLTELLPRPVVCVSSFQEITQERLEFSSVLILTDPLVERFDERAAYFSGIGAWEERSASNAIVFYWNREQSREAARRAELALGIALRLPTTITVSRERARAVYRRYLEITPASRR